MRLVDLSHSIEQGMPVFSPTVPQPVISTWQSHSQAAVSGKYVDCTCEISEIRLVTSLGTYIDSPYHFFPHKPSIEALRLEQLVLAGVVVNCRHLQARQPIEPDLLAGLDIAGKAVLFYTGWDRYWDQPAYAEFPFVSETTAQVLVQRGTKLAGVDCLVIDDLANPRRPAHVNLLGNDVLIVENLTNLGKLPPQGFTFHAVPVKVQGVAAFPVRAYAVIYD